MKAITFQDVGEVAVDSIPDPAIISQSDVIVKVKACAICGSDLHVFHGREKGIDRHTAMGHEFMGEVVEVGRDVRQLKKGDMVMSPFTTSCGDCFYCRLGLTCRCIHGQLFGWVEKGEGLHGGQGEFVRVPLAESSLVKIPESVTNDEALLLGDVMSTGFFAARQALTRESSCVVIGCGPVGLMAVLGAFHYGASKVFAVDGVAERLQMAAEFGATPIAVDSPSHVAEIHDMTGGRGPDAVLEAVGSSAAIDLAYKLVRPGGIISSVGVCNDAALPFSPVQAYNKNLTYKTGRCPARQMMDELTPFVQSKKYPISRIFTHRMKLDDGVKAYDIFANKKDNCLKIVLEP